jgi:histidinol-phosphate aminotransferase
VRWGGVAALADTANQEKVKAITIELREKTANALRSQGYNVIPSETNFFMVHVGREITPVIDEFRKRGVAVGRRFPPMVEHLRVSIGTADEMDRFLVAFKEIFPARNATSA